MRLLPDHPTLPLRQAPGRLRATIGRRSCPVELEVTAWSGSRSEIGMRPVGRSIPLDEGWRQRRYLDLAHTVADHLAVTFERSSARGTTTWRERPWPRLRVSPSDERQLSVRLKERSSRRRLTKWIHRGHGRELAGQPWAKQFFDTTASRPSRSCDRRRFLSPGCSPEAWGSHRECVDHGDNMGDETAARRRPGRPGTAVVALVGLRYPPSPTSTARCLVSRVFSWRLWQERRGAPLET
jgi:hypothetical protein